jgi:predicted alternative tryptophan synthase beta-subunit
VAKIALARKLLTVVWTLLHHGVCFDEELFTRNWRKQAMEKWKAQNASHFSTATTTATGRRYLRRLQGEPGQLVHPLSIGD